MMLLNGMLTHLRTLCNGMMIEMHQLLKEKGIIIENITLAVDTFTFTTEYGPRKCNIFKTKQNSDKI